MKKMKLPCLFENISSCDNDKRLVKCSIKVQHDKDNPNGSYFDDKDMETCANKTLRYTPILGSIIYDEESEEYKLNGHDMEYTIVNTEDGYDLKISHIERIYGFVAPDAEIKIEYDEEKDKNYLVTEGYLWKNYMDELEDVLNKKDGQTQVSMEISVNESFKREDGLIQITDYTFEGITMLGVPEAMKGSNLQIFSDNVLSKLKSNMEELAVAYSLEKEECDLSKENENLEENKEKQEFGISVQNITDQIITQVGARMVEREDYWGDKYQSREFYFMDILPDDKIAIVENADWSCRQYFGVPYSINEDVITLDFENKKSYMQEWREMEGGIEPKVYSTEDVQLKEHIINKFDSIDSHEDELKEFNELKNNYGELKKELNELKEFKENYDRVAYENEVEEVSKMFELDEEEVKELKEKALSKEINVEQFKEKLGFKFAMKQLANKKETKKEFSSEIQIIDDKENVQGDPYFESLLAKARNRK
ncbi:MAG: hypothetical protein E6356_16840 [Terrisporobacter othiniensis]|nr:hypothetical protein [Terrisporobacter othiniensis]